MNKGIINSVLLIPPLVHFGIIIAHVFMYEDYEWTSYDTVWNVSVGVYFLLALLLSIYFNAIAGLKLILVTYSSVFALLLGNVLIGAILGAGVYATPWAPMHVIRDAPKTMPGISGKIEFTINRLGIRGPEFHEGAYDRKILCVGGSTTECLYVTNEQSWPWALMKKLNDQYEAETYVGNAGISGHFTRNHEYLIQNYAFIEKFDHVVLMIGINDMGRLMRDDYEHQVETFVPRTLKEDYATKGKPYYKRWFLYKYFMAGRLTADRATVIQDEEGLWLENMREERRRAAAMETQDEVPAELSKALERYERDILNIVKACRARGLGMTFITQPTIYSETMTDEAHRLLSQQTDDGRVFSHRALKEMMDAYNQRLLAVCARENIDCLDLASMLPKDTTVFYDDCHFNMTGCDLVSDAIAKHFAKFYE